MLPTLYIKEEDFKYLEVINKTLPEPKRGVITEKIIKMMSKKFNIQFKVITILADDYLNTHGIDNGQIITKTLIKKLYREIKSA